MREAFEFHEKCLGGKVVAMVHYGDMPNTQELPSGMGGRIMHARLVLGDQVLMMDRSAWKRPDRLGTPVPSRVRTASGSAVRIG